MRDSDVREAVTGWLRRKFADDTRIVEEMGIWNGSVRIDVAVINGELQGFELKSERDTLDRLESQAALYNQVFDRVTLVTAKRHLDKATAMIPGWWGITCATMPNAGTPTLRAIRRAGRNPSVDPIQLGRLLWRAEALKILERRGLAKGFRSRPVEDLIKRLVANFSLTALAREVREALKVRDGWLGQPIGNQGDVATRRDRNPCSPVAGSRPSAADMLNSLISPTSS